MHVFGENLREIVRVIKGQFIRNFFNLLICEVKQTAGFLYFQKIEIIDNAKAAEGNIYLGKIIHT